MVKSKMNFAESYLKQLNKTPKRIYTKEQTLADEIWRYFEKKYPFPRIMKDIKNKGFQAIYEIYNEIKKSEDIKNRLSLYVWKVRENKIEFTPR